MKPFFVGFAAMMVATLSLAAGATQGEELEVQMWNDMKHQNWSAVEARIASDFQSVHSFGALNRAGEIDLIKKLYLGNYKISDVKVTERDNTIIVSYMISVAEKIDSKELPAKSTPRLSVWQKIDGKWQWIAHVNLNPVPK